jgi:hypothetical protein
MSLARLGCFPSLRKLQAAFLLSPDSRRSSRSPQKSLWGVSFRNRKVASSRLRSTGAAYVGGPRNPPGCMGFMSSSVRGLACFGYPTPLDPMINHRMYFLRGGLVATHPTASWVGEPLGNAMPIGPRSGGGWSRLPSAQSCLHQQVPSSSSPCSLFPGSGLRLGSEGLPCDVHRLLSPLHFYNAPLEGLDPRR